MTKGALASRRRELALLERALPSLRLKRQQLRIEGDKAREALAQATVHRQALLREAEALPVTGSDAEALAPLLMLDAVERGSERRLGVDLPVIHAVRWSQAAYSLADTPVWYDRALELIRALAEAALACEAAQGRVAALGEALKRAVQRVNLLEQVLIPRARRDIARIGIFLADNERTALARAKLAAARRGRPVAVEQSA